MKKEKREENIAAGKVDFEREIRRSNITVSDEEMYAYLTELNKVIIAGYVFLLILVLIIGIGKEDTGTTGWISLGPVNIQPSEFAKIGYIITFATHLSNVQRKIHKFSTLMGLCLHAAIRKESTRHMPFGLSTQKR